MIRVLLSGRLYGQPERRTGKSGKPFVTVKLRVDAGEESPTWASAIAFGVEAERLAVLRDGDAVALAGRATLQAFQGKDGGAPRASLSIVVDEVCAVRRKPKDFHRHGGQRD